MQLNDHARVLYAYLARITPAKRDELVKRLTEWDYASMNLGLSSQSNAMHRFTQACEEAVADMTDHDLGLIREVVQRAGH